MVRDQKWVNDAKLSIIENGAGIWEKTLRDLIDTLDAAWIELGIKDKILRSRVAEIERLKSRLSLFEHKEYMGSVLDPMD